MRLPVALPLQVKDFRTFREPIDDHVSRCVAMKDLIPFAEGFVRGHYCWPVVVVAPRDDLEEQVGLLVYSGPNRSPIPI